MTRPHTAMVFAAGFGTRMRPITNHTPKPLVPVCGVPLLDYRLNKLHEFGIQRVVINTHHLAEKIQDYVAHNRHRWPQMECVISHEVEILETGGGLVHARQHLGNDPIFIVNSDVIWLDNGTPALERLAGAHTAATPITMLLQPRARAIGYHGNGDFEVDEHGYIRQPPAPRTHVFSGVQLFNPALLDDLKPTAFSLSEMFKDTLAAHQLRGIVHTGDWLHVDSPESLQAAEDFLTA